VPYPNIDKVYMLNSIQQSIDTEYTFKLTLSVLSVSFDGV